MSGWPELASARWSPRTLDRRGTGPVATIEVDPVRADPRRRAGDPPPEDPARGDLHRDDAGHPAQPDDPRGRRCSPTAGSPGGELDQVVQAFDPVDPAGVPQLAAGPGRRGSPAGQSLNDALGNLPRFVAGAGDVLDVLTPSRRRSAAGAQHGRRLRGGQPGPRPAPPPDHRGRRDVRGDGVRAAGAGRDDPDPPDLPRRDQGDAGQPPDVRREHRPADPDLRPAARDLAPTLHDVRRAGARPAPTFREARPADHASKTGLPALRDIPGRSTRCSATSTRSSSSSTRSSSGSSTTSTRSATSSPTAPARWRPRRRRRPRRRLATTCASTRPLGPETLAIYPTRYPNNRGNAYQAGTGLADSPRRPGT